MEKGTNSNFDYILHLGALPIYICVCICLCSVLPESPSPTRRFDRGTLLLSYASLDFLFLQLEARMQIDGKILREQNLSRLLLVDPKYKCDFIH